MWLRMTERRSDLPVLLLRDRESFEEWLDQQPFNARGAWLKFPKKVTGEPGPTKAEAIDAALCFGWIDSQLGRYNECYWLVRLTPRKARSKWSQLNKKRATDLLAEGRMRKSGLTQVCAAKADGRWDAAYPPASSATVPADLQHALNANRKAAQFFATLKGASRYAILYRIGSVKRPHTRARKIAEYIAMLERGKTIHG